MRENPLELCDTLAKIWNQLAKENGWTQRKEGFQILQTSGLPAFLIQTLEKNQANPPFQPEEAFQIILQTWNWKKSPAPIRLICSPKKWEAFVYSKKKLEEEVIQNISDRIEQTKKIVLAEWKKQRDKTECPTTASKRTEEYLRATGKWKNLTTQEKLEACQLLETLAQPMTPP